MAVIQGEGSTGGRRVTGHTVGESSGFSCRISNADMVGIIDNLLTRIQRSETEIARLKSQLTKATQLSNISQQVGWVGGITYMGVKGWTRTAAGTLIPPPGVTFADLGILPATGSGSITNNSLVMVLKDVNGNILFGFNAIDGLYGTKVEQWNQANEPDYALYHFGGPPVQESRGITWDSLSTAGFAFAATLTVAQDGLYLVNAAGSWDYSITTFGAIQVSCAISSKTSGGVTIDTTKTSSVGAFVETNPGTDSGDNVVGTSNTNMYNLTAGQKISIDMAALLTDGAAYDGSTMADVNVSVLRVGAGE